MISGIGHGESGAYNNVNKIIINSFLLKISIITPFQGSEFDEYDYNRENIIIIMKKLQGLSSIPQWLIYEISFKI